MEVTNGFVNNPICVISDLEVNESGRNRNRKSSASVTHARHYGKRSLNSARMLTTNLKLFGLYFDEKISPESDRRFNALPKYLSNLQKIYCYAVTFILWLNVMRMTTVFVRPKAFSSTVIWRIMNFFWAVMSAALHTIYVRACSNGKLHSVVRDLCDTMENSKRIRTISIIYSSIAWLFLIFNTTVMAYMQFLNHSNASFIVLSPVGSLVSLTEPTLTLVRALYLILHAYLSACGFFVPAMDCLLAYALSLQFSAFNKDVIAVLDDGPENQDGDMELSERLQNGAGRIETFRLKHQRLCAILKESDWFISKVFAVSISFEFSVFIFLPLNLLYYMTPDDVGIDYAKNFIWLVVATICFTVTIYEAVTISTEVRVFICQRPVVLAPSVFAIDVANVQNFFYNF